MYRIANNSARKRSVRAVGGHVTVPAGGVAETPRRIRPAVIDAMRAVGVDIQQVAGGASAPPVTSPLVERAQFQDDRDALRAEYERVLGKRPFPGWSSDVLRAKIAEARDDG